MEKREQRRGAGRGESTRDVRDAVSPADTAGVLNRFVYGWLTPTLSRGWSRPLVQTDLPTISRRHDAPSTYKRFIGAWNAELSKSAEEGRPASLMKAMWAVCKRQWLLSMLVFGASTACRLSTPFALRALVSYLEQGQSAEAAAAGTTPTAADGVPLVVWFAMSILLEGLLGAHGQGTALRTGLDVRSIFMEAILHHTLDVSNGALQGTTTGTLVNLLASDAQRFVDIFGSFHQLWTAPLVIVFCMGILATLLGPSAFVGLAVLLSFFPISAPMARVQQRAHRQKHVEGDRRMKILTECVGGIKVIKMYAWEGSFTGRIMEARDREARELRTFAFVKAITIPLAVSMPQFAAVVAMATFTAIEGHPPSTEDAFASLMLFMILSMPFTVLPLAVANLIQSRSSMRRLQRFMLMQTVVPRRADGARPAAAGAAGSGAGGGGRSPGGAAARASAALDAVAASTPSAVATAGAAAAAGAETSTAAAAGADADIDLAINMPRSDFRWDEGAKAPLLHGIAMQVRKGELVAVVGGVGSGKSSLLMAMLGEMDCRRAAAAAAAAAGGGGGSATVGTGGFISGSVAFAPQVPFIQNLSVKANILFGAKLSSARYSKAVAASALDSDLGVLPAGDATEIGERGVNLSGGQKQRVSLARCVYAGADVVLLDDPLSAVDAHVGKHIFDNLVVGALEGVTRVLVTNAVHFLNSPAVSRIIVMDEGRIVQQGTFQELLGAGGSAGDGAATGEGGAAARNVFKELMEAQAHKGGDDDEEYSSGGDEDGGEGGAADPAAVALSVGGSDAAPGSPAARGVSATSARSKRSTSRGRSRSGGAGSTSGEGGSVHKPAAGAQLVDDESMARGAMGWRTWQAYGDAMGGMGVTLSILLFVVLAEVGLMLCGAWLAWMTEDALGLTNAEYVAWFLVVGACFILMVMARSILWAWAAVRAATTLHNRSLRRLLRAPMWFFETTPAGRIFSRMSSDLNDVDVRLPQIMEFAAMTLMRVISVPVFVVIVTPWFLTVLVPVACVYWMTREYYRRSCRELQRLDAVSRSPLYSLHSECLGGLETIRAFGAQPWLMREVEDLIRYTNTALFSVQGANVWLQIRLTVVGWALATGAAVFFVVDRETVNPALSGLALVMLVNAVMNLMFSVRFTTEVEAKMNAVERLEEYALDLPQERPPVLPEDAAVPGTWPAEGAVSFSGVALRYRPELDLVVRDLNVDIKAREKIGIVGRTGAGKSSLLTLLFRLVEPSSGEILIDGRSTSDLGLELLRRKLSVIPQEPVVFSGTIRLNLDPFGDHDDDELWEALRRCHLAAAVRLMGRAAEADGDRDADAEADAATPSASGTTATAGNDAIAAAATKDSAPVPRLRQESGASTLAAPVAAGVGLDAVVAEGGGNMSVGQRQLLCLGRALLRRTPVLLLDEATAAVDPATDKLIQHTIREEFADRTVLTIAHRLNSIIDSDRVLVMDKGRAAEFGPPAELLVNTDGVFYSLVAQTGRENAAALLDAARHSQAAHAVKAAAGAASAFPPEAE